MNFDKAIEKRVKECQTILSMAGFSSFPISVEVSKLGRGVAGQAHLAMNHVELSEDYMNSEHIGEVLHQTLGHEIAHLYVSMNFPRAKQHHGKEFRFVMRCLGLEGKTYHNMIIPGMATKRQPRMKKRYIYKNVNDDICGLTAQKHNKQQAYINATGKSFFTKNGLPIMFTGEIKTYN